MLARAAGAHVVRQPRERRVRGGVQPGRVGGDRRRAPAAQPRRDARAGLPRRDRGAGPRRLGPVDGARPATAGVVNTSGGVVHFTGIAWAGEAGAPAPPPGAGGQRPVAFASGACLALPRAAWERARRLLAETSSCTTRTSTCRCACACAVAGSGSSPAARGRPRLRVRQGAGEVARCSSATAGRRSCAATRARCWLAVAPALLGLELALWPAALAGGWGGEKLARRSTCCGALPRLLRERREIQATRTVSPARFADGLTARPRLAVPRRAAGARGC